MTSNNIFSTVTFVFIFNLLLPQKTLSLTLNPAYSIPPKIDHLSISKKSRFISETKLESPCFYTISMTTSTGVDVLYVFHCSETFVLPEMIEGEELIDVQLFIQAAGGGGGYGNAAGGAGAGGIEYQSNLNLIPNIPYDVVVGKGGVGSVISTKTGTNGEDSSFGTNWIAIGGGGGGSVDANQGNGQNGGSGGGGAYTSNRTTGNSGQSQSSFGRSGGNGNGSGNGNQRSGGGGGGAGNSGGPGNGNSGGNGGDGIVIDGSQGGISILGNVPDDFLTSNSISLIYAAGGGGNGSNPGQGNGGGLPSGGSGGSSIGGNGNRNGIGENGVNNTGSGGGAGTLGGGKGGDGIVIIRLTYRILSIVINSIRAEYDPKDRSSLVSWNITPKGKNRIFDLQRSNFNIGNWQTIHSFSESTISNDFQAINFRDMELPVQGGFVYYRIKQTDEDGTIIFSETKSISIPNQNSSTFWRIFPNPSDGSRIKVEPSEIIKLSENDVFVQITNISGLDQLSIRANPEDLSSTFNDFFRNAKSGVYSIQFKWEGKIETQKFIKF